MKQYLDLLKEVRDKGANKEPAREGVPQTRSIFGYQFRHDLKKGFPLLTTKNMFWKGIVVELLWFLKGDTNIKYLVDRGVKIWDEDAYNFYKKKVTEISERNDGEPPINLVKETKDRLEIYSFEEFVNIISKLDYNKLPCEEEYIMGDCGFQYGKLWRKHPLVGDQIINLIDGLQNKPFSRRHLISSVPVNENNLSLYPCHCMAQFNVRPIDKDKEARKLFPEQFGESAPSHAEMISFGRFMEYSPDYYLDCQVYIRSNDLFLGAPFNIASYALLTHIIAKICGYRVGDLVYTIGDAHVYENHIDVVNEQLGREPNQLPNLELSDDVDWKDVLNEGFNYNYLMESLVNYNPHSKIKAKLNTGLK